LLSASQASPKTKRASTSTHRRNISWHGSNVQSSSGDLLEAERPLDVGASPSTIFHLHVTVVQARDLKDKDIFGTIDP
jgi:hypothetical protein